MRVGQGVDVHPFGGHDRRLVLAGVEVPGAPGLAGHSDGDVVAHAVADALLGACALGDLGERFGIDDSEMADADSMVLLADVVAAVTTRGWVLSNLHATVVAQRPRIAPHRDAMRAGLAAVLGADVDDVAVSATTTDRLGFVGRDEGIACTAVVLLRAHDGAVTGS